MMTEEQTTAQQTLAAKHGSYYYAHNRQRDANAPIDPFACGPVKLASEVVIKSSRPLKEISQYAWTDDAENKKVKIYLTQDGISGITKEQIALKWRPQRVKITIKDMDGHDHYLRLCLSHDIVDATFKKKKNKIIIFLNKRNSFKWYDLTTKNNNESSSDEESVEDEEDKTEKALNANGIEEHSEETGMSESIFTAAGSVPELGSDQITEHAKAIETAREGEGTDMTTLD